MEAVPSRIGAARSFGAVRAKQMSRCITDMLSPRFLARLWELHAFTHCGNANGYAKIFKKK
jgi:hypothetical protein